MEFGGCHDNTVIEMVPEMYYYIQKCVTMYYLTVSMATAKQPEAMKCAAYANSSSQCTLKIEKSVLLKLFCILQIWEN